ncbi:hypothetical protein [Thiomonas sp.]
MGLLSAKIRQAIRRGAWSNTASQMPDACRARYIRINGVLRFHRLSREDAAWRWANLPLKPKDRAVLEYADGQVIALKIGEERRPG